MRAAKNPLGRTADLETVRKVVDGLPPHTAATMFFPWLGGKPAFVSEWSPDAAERAALARGARLRITALANVPTSVGVASGLPEDGAALCDEARLVVIAERFSLVYFDRIFSGLDPEQQHVALRWARSAVEFVAEAFAPLVPA